MLVEFEGLFLKPEIFVAEHEARGLVGMLLVTIVNCAKKYVWCNLHGSDYIHNAPI